jgi:hypothetical protein
MSLFLLLVQLLVVVSLLVSSSNSLISVQHCMGGPEAGGKQRDQEQPH